MLPFFVKQFANPAALYSAGVRAKQALEQSRAIIGRILGAPADTIIFTSGGTEANNLAIYGITQNCQRPGHLITSRLEHPAVANPLKSLTKQGWKITYLKNNRQGLVDPRQAIKAIRANTVLISIGYANNEIGTVQPIAEIGRQLLRWRQQHRRSYPYFHTDACQAAGFLDLKVEKLHVDLMTINASKIYGPKGSGLLYVRRGITLTPLMRGGGQERGARSGTENVPGIIGLAKALALAEREKSSVTKKLNRLTAYFYQTLLNRGLVGRDSLNGPAIGTNRLPNNLNLTFSGIDGETLLLYLDRWGIAASAGSACAASSAEPSATLQAIGRRPAAARSLRFTLGRTTTKSDLDYTVNTLQTILSKFK